MKIHISKIRAGKELTPCWVDQVVVDRVLLGRLPGREITYAERVEVARRLDSPDLSVGTTGWAVSGLLGGSHASACELVRLARGALAVAA
jgi:hypothetical protein